MRDNDDDLTREETDELSALVIQGWAIRGVQLFIVGLGAYLAYFGGRGWPAFIIGCGLAVWLQTQLPIAPAWTDRFRKK